MIVQKQEEKMKMIIILCQNMLHRFCISHIMPMKFADPLLLPEEIWDYMVRLLGTAILNQKQKDFSRHRPEEPYDTTDFWNTL